MSLFERVFDRERLMYVAACAGIIDDRGNTESYLEKSSELGAAIFRAIDENFDNAEKVVFCSTLLMFIDEVLQDESDNAWDSYSQAVIDEQIGGMSDG